MGNINVSASVPRASRCVLCQNTGPNGGQRYQPRTGQSDCLECPKGGTVNGARTLCSYYGPGRQPGRNGAENCAAGHAKSGGGAFLCGLCSGVGPNGGQRYQPHTGQAACLECTTDGSVNAARTVCGTQSLPLRIAIIMQPTGLDAAPVHQPHSPRWDCRLPF